MLAYQRYRPQGVRQYPAHRNAQWSILSKTDRLTTAPIPARLSHTHLIRARRGNGDSDLRALGGISFPQAKEKETPFGVSLFLEKVTGLAFPAGKATAVEMVHRIISKRRLSSLVHAEIKKQTLSRLFFLVEVTGLEPVTLCL